MLLLLLLLPPSLMLLLLLSLQVLQRMLDLWRSHSNHRHMARLDFIIILLIVVEVILAFFEVVGFIDKGVLDRRPQP